jgi:hypothetical protein
MVPFLTFSNENADQILIPPKMLDLILLDVINYIHTWTYIYTYICTYIKGIRFDAPHDIIFSIHLFIPHVQTFSSAICF